MGCLALAGAAAGCQIPDRGAEGPEHRPPLPPPDAADEHENDAIAQRYSDAKAHGELSPTRCHELATAFGELDRKGTSRLAGFNEGAVLHECGEFDQAQAVYDRLLTRDPERSDARNNLGVLAWDRGDVASAQQLFEAASQREPYNVTLRTNLAASERELFVRTGESRWFDMAEEDLQAALAVDAASRRAYEGLATLYYERARAGDGSYALLAELVSTQGKRVLETRGEPSVRLVNLDGLLAMMRGRPNEARRLFGAAAKLDPSAPEPRVNAAFLALRQRDVAAARDDLQASAAQLDREQSAPSAAIVADVTLALGVAHTRTGEYGRAEQKYVAAANDPRATYNLGLLYQERIAPQDGDGRQANVQAKAHFQRFLEEAGTRDDLEIARADAKHRIANIDAYVAAIDDGERIAREVAALEKAQREEEEARRAHVLELERRALEAAQQREVGADAS